MYDDIEHIFKEILPQHGFVFRQEQMELSMLIYDSLRNKRIAFCEAGVGSGKTLAYIIAAAIYYLQQKRKRPIIISTSTIALQKAITEEYLPQISGILQENHIIKMPLRFVVRKGKTHYPCDLRLHGYLSSVAHMGKDKALIQTLRSIEHADYREGDLSLYPISRYVKDRICVQGRCPDTCSRRISCKYQAFMNYCMTGDFFCQIANGNYVFAHISNKQARGNGILPEYSAIIFDEAHKLLEAARQIYGKELEKSDVTDFLKRINTDRIPVPAERAIANSWIEMLHARNTKLFSLVKGTRYSEDGNTYTAKLGAIAKLQMQKLCEDLLHLITLCRYYGDGNMKTLVPQLHEGYYAVRDKLEYFFEHNDLILWLEEDEQGARMCGMPSELDKRLHKDVWSKPESFVLTSGTMSVNGDFELIERDLGISFVAKSRISAKTIPSPFAYDKNALLYIPANMPFPSLTDKGYLQAVAEEIMRLVEVTCGHTVILFTSYRLLDRVYHLTKDVITTKYPVFHLGRGRVDVLADFKQSRNGVLFASDTAGEGVDFIGDILSSLIIVKLPFAVPDPVTEHEKAQYLSLTAYQQAVTVPAMLVKLKQYVGRAIRVETDTAVISILDSRVSMGGKYRRPVLAALPQMPVTNRISAVKAFIQEKKDNVYFL